MTKKYLNIEEVRDMFCETARLMLDEEGYLCDLDRHIGDGDHGRNMSEGFREVLEELPRMQYTCVEDVFLAVGTILMDISGGASGVLFGTMFVSGVVKRRKSYTMTLQDFSEIFRVSLDAIISRGKSHPGDKTLVDALEPAVRSLEESADQEAAFPEALQKAAQAAKGGAESTRDMAAMRGRARYFDGRGLGLQDPGATSVWLIFRGMSRWADEHDWSDGADREQVITLTLNPCQDKTIDIASMQYTGTNKILGVQSDISGKGINVSMVLHGFGMQTRCLGFNYSEDARIVERFLDNQGIPYDFVRVPGLLRTNIKIFERDKGCMTEFNESGLSVPKEAVNKLIENILHYSERAKILTLSGSIPSGVPVNIYRHIISEANLTGCRTILDTSGAALAEGIKARPFLIKPNMDELTGVYREALESGRTMTEIACGLVEDGISYICLSMGDRGAYLVCMNGIYYAPAVPVTVRGVQGAGDSMVAGMCRAILEGRSDADILAYGMAAAAGSLEYTGTKLCQEQDFRRLLGSVRVEKREQIL